MSSPSRAWPLRPAHTLLAALVAVALPMTASANEAPRTEVEALEVWLDVHAPWPRRAGAPAIQHIRSTDAARLSGAAMATGGSTPRAYYDAASATIYLIEPWSPSDPHDLSVLLHELVHHRQAAVGYWRCPGAQELPAYRLQDAWLKERGLEARVNWIAVVLEAGCTARDKHPD